MYFQSPGYILKGITSSYGTSIFKLLRSSQTVFQTGCTSSLLFYFFWFCGLSWENNWVDYKDIFCRMEIFIQYSGHKHKVVGVTWGPQNVVLHSTQKRILSLSALLRKGSEAKCNEPAGAWLHQNQGWGGKDRAIKNTHIWQGKEGRGRKGIQQRNIQTTLCISREWGRSRPGKLEERTQKKLGEGGPPGNLLISLVFTLTNDVSLAHFTKLPSLFVPTNI